MAGERGTHYLLRIGAQQAQTAMKKQTEMLSDVHTTLIGKEKLAGAQQPNLQEHTIPTAHGGTAC